MNKHLDTSTFTHADSPKIRRHSLQHNFEYGYKSLSKHPITQKYLKHASKQNSRPVHSLMLSSQFFFCIPCILPPFISLQDGFHLTWQMGLFVVMSWWLKGEVQPDRAYPSPYWTRLVHHRILSPIWPKSLNYGDIHPVMRCWHQLFHLWQGDLWRAGASYSSPYKSSGPAHSPTA